MTEDDTFNKLRKIPIHQMAVILRNKFGSNFFTEDAEPILSRYGWTWKSYFNELNGANWVSTQD